MEIAGQDAQDGRLARAVRTQQPEHFAGAGFERDVLDAHATAVVLGEMLRDDDRRHEPRARGGRGAAGPGAQLM